VRHHGRSGDLRTLLLVPMDLRHLGAIWERLAVAGNAGLEGRNDLWIAEDRYEQVSGLTDGNDLPLFVSPELGEGEPIRHLHGVFVLRGQGRSRPQPQATIRQSRSPGM